MELPFHLEFISIVLLVVTIILLLGAKKPKDHSNTKGKSNPLPQPPGALPFIGHLHLLGGPGTTIFRTLGAMSDACGPIFCLKLGQHKTIVMSSWEVVKDCFTNNDMNIASRPYMAVSKYLAYDHASFFISPYGRYWREMRKMSTVELLSNKRLEILKHVRVSEVNSCLKDLYKECTKLGSNCCTPKISLGKSFECLTLNIAIAKIAGKRFCPKSYNENGTFASRFKHAIGRATHVAGVAIPSDYIPGIEWLDVIGYIRSLKETHNEIDIIIGHWLDEHIKKRQALEKQGSSIEEVDFMDVMLSNITDGYGTSGYTRDTIIKATSLTLLLTASESTSITLTWAVSLLLNHPKALKEAQDELDQQIGKQRWVQESDMTNLPYLQAIVKETFRLYPPSPLSGPREAQEDCHIAGHFIPKGARLTVNIWKLHRDPRVWADPNQFRPDRFLNENKDVDFRGHHFEYVPFSLGRRSCPGMSFGLQVVQLMLASLIQGFDLWANGGPIDMTEGPGLALPKKGPLDAIITPRLPIELYEAL